MMDSSRDASPSRWFREPMVWMVIAIPASAVVVGILMLVLSIQSYDGLVVDDYYTRGKEINRVLERDRLARQYAIGATLAMAADQVVLELRHDGRLVLPATVNLFFLHRTRTGRDRAMVLTAGPDGLFHGQVGEIPPGRFVVQLETMRWRIGGEMERPRDRVVHLHSR